MDEDNTLGGQTDILPQHDPTIQQALSRQEGREMGTAHLVGKGEVMLLIGNDVRRFSLSENTRWILGRFDKDPSHPDQVDLSPYSALDLGISRFHVELQIEDNQLFVIDLNSTNGSYLNGEPLIPKQRALVRNGDELLLGRLAIQVLFR